MDPPRRVLGRPRRPFLGVVLTFALLAIPVTVGLTGVSSATPGVLPQAVLAPDALGPFPYDVGLGYDGPNVTGANVVVANLTLPAEGSANYQGNFTLGLQIADTACTVATAAVAIDNSTFSFTDIFAPGASSPKQAWAHVPIWHGFTYQLAVTFFSGSLTAEVYNVSAGNFYVPGGGTPLAQASDADASATALVLGPQVCGGAHVPWSANLTTLFAPASPYIPALDYLFQREAFGSSASSVLALAPNLWSPFRHNAPAAIALTQAWATSAILSDVTASPVVSFSVLKAPPAAVDVGSSFSLKVLGTTRETDVTEVPAARAVLEFTGTSDTTSNGFLACTSVNGTTALYYPGTSGFGGEYGYAVPSNTSTSDLAWSSMANPPAGTALDLNCTTSDLTASGNITIYGLAYDEYFSTSPDPTYLDALSSGPRDFFGMSAWSATVRVNPQLIAQASVTPAVVLPHDTVYANATETGGTAPVLTSWYINGTVQACTSLDCQFSWTTPGTYAVWAAATDGTGVRVVSLHTNITVDPSLTATVTPAPTGAGSANEPLAMHATGAGGTRGYTYAFWTNASASPFQKSSNAYANLTLASPGTYEAWVVVNDSRGDVARSVNSTITIYPDMALTLSPLLATTEAGLTATLFTATVTGAVGTITYTWHTGALSTNGTCARTCGVEPSGTGTTQIWYDASDTTGRTVASPHANLTVLAHISFSSWTAASKGDEGGNATVMANFAGGKGPETYVWSVDGRATGTCDTSDSCSIILPAGTTASVTVNATDALGAVASAPAWNITEVTPLQVALTPAPLGTAEVGVAITLRATATHGTGGDSYTFYQEGTPPAVISTGTSSSARFVPSAAGVVQVWVVANDSSGFENVSLHTNLTVVAAVQVAISPGAPGPISLGATLDLTATATAGKGPYTFCWSIDGVPVPDCPQGATFNDTPTALGQGTVTVQVTDALGGVGSSAAVNLTVIAPRTGSVVIAIAPGEGGSVRLNGSLAGPGTFHSLLWGSYPLIATPAAGFAFTGWESSAPSLALASTADLSTTVTVSGNGTITATFVGTRPLAVEVGLSPAGAGTILLNGTEVSATTNLSFRAGLYTLQAFPGSGEDFTQWTVSGGVTVTTGGSAGELNVSGPGSVVADFTAATRPTDYDISFDVSPSGQDVGIVFRGTAYVPGSVVTVTAGSYGISLELPSGDTFKAWVVTGGGATVASVSDPSTTLTVTGSATVTAEVNVPGSSTLILGLTIDEAAILGVLALAVVIVVAVGLSRRGKGKTARKEAYTPKAREGGSS